jgi:hypothetical protein
MGSSPLDFTNSEGFRKKLITRNLTPYAKSPNRATPPTNYEYIQSDTSVIDSPDQLIDEPSFANQLYPLNQWGSDGGFKQVPDPVGLLNTHSNEGEYSYIDGRIIDEALPESQKWKSINAYSNGSNGVLDSADFFSSIDLIGPNSRNVYNNQPYPTFNSSSYSPLSILLTPDPQGSNGLLSNDSFIARLGAQTLRKSFEDRIATQIRRNTIGRANVFNVRSGTDILNIVTGRVPLIEPDYTITRPSNVVLAATDFTLRLGGSILPVSPIAGSYWDTNVQLGQPTTIQQMNNAFRRSTVGKFVNKLLGGGQTGSQIMYNNMGGGQKSRLFANIDFNRYKPSFDRTLFDRLAGAIVGSTTNNSDFYIGSTSSDPSRVFSPSGEIPVNSFGAEQQTAVYGPQELAQLYEGPSKEIRLGANGPTYSSGGGIEGGLTWVSPKYKGNAGKKVGIGGEITNSDEDFRPSSYNTTESTNIAFREGSILDDTQRIIDSQPQGGKRLQHVGNAIDQVSKVFNDGYKELTKGSRVIKYTGSIGQEVGTEYCRVFAKDIPYLQYNDLQKTDGITTNGRRFSYSVLDKTYNLNIAPNKQEGGQGSTNLINGEGGTSTNVGYAKKYMFSLENLSWRTAGGAGGGASVSDLPICERGPNGGRVMWFPPYGLTFSESVSANWNSSEFLGRPEPIYTYKSTSRTGSLTWKIVVDHPSVLNVIVNKVLNNETNNTRINSMLDAFFAGCLKYDLYELAKKYYTVNPNDLYQLQQAITSKEMTKEEIQFTKETIQTGVNSPNGAGSAVAESTPLDSKYWDKYQQIGFYFANDYPQKDNVTSYDGQYTIYIGQEGEYAKKANASQTKVFFDSVVTPNYNTLKSMVDDIVKQLTQYSKGEVTITLNASCSAPASIAYNKELSKRRIESAKKFFETNSALTAYTTNKRLLIIETKEPPGEDTQVLQYDTTTKNFKPGTSVNCSDENINARKGDIQVGSKDVYTTNAMACRRAVITSISSNLTQPTSTPQPQYTQVVKGNVVTETVNTQKVEQSWKPRDNITKRVLRSLLSECDYFETIKQETPMVYDNLKEKLKFFQPAFHSMTPEGLNSRLTFLQQCLRPGDTIPTIKEVGGSPVLQYNNATNTSFGAPPVLVLRVGDFYNTKIIPTSLNITYEELDLNPEGIGVQPMIANITMAFNFVGGSGLKESIDKLQNALTFNYYANTEIYDDRADTTENSEYLKSLDKEFLAMASPPGAPAINQSEPPNGQDNNSSIGTILTNSATTTGETGTITYRDFMVKVVNETQNYFTNVINKQKEVVSQYNNAMRQQWQMERNYVGGTMSVDFNKKTSLFGKPTNIQKSTNEIFDLLIKDINSGDEGFIKFINIKNFSDKAKKVIKENYINLLNNRKNIYQNDITKIVQDITTLQQSYIQTLARVNTITYNGTPNTGTDGYQKKNGPVVIYVTSGTSKVSASSNGASDTLVELVNDVKTLQDKIIEFNKITNNPITFMNPNDKKEYSGKLIYEIVGDGNSPLTKISATETFIPFSKNENFASPSFKKVYMILSNEVIDSKKYETFKKEMIGNIIGNTKLLSGADQDIEIQFDEYWIGTARPLFNEENTITKNFIDYVEKNNLKNFVKFTPFDSKTREFLYSTDNQANPNEKDSQQNLIKGLGASTNQNTNTKTWCDSNGNVTSIYISKAKLN